MKSSETATVLGLQSKAFDRLLCLPRVSRQLKSLETGGSFIAERNGEAMGCVGLYRLEPSGWFQIEHLATRDPRDVDLAKRLLGRELNYVRMKKPRYLKASTPSIQPYVDVYEKAGFEPVRRKLDISWDLEELIPASGGRGAEITRIKQGSRC